MFLYSISRLVFGLMVFSVSTGLCENDLFLSFCGTWHHGNTALNLNVNISTGCNEMLISANENSMSISGQITAHCTNSDVIPLNKYGLDTEQDTDFCVKWEPLLDMLLLQVNQSFLRFTFFRSSTQSVWKRVVYCWTQCRWQTVWCLNGARTGASRRKNNTNFVQKPLGVTKQRDGVKESAIFHSFWHLFSQTLKSSDISPLIAMMTVFFSEYCTRHSCQSG